MDAAARKSFEVQAQVRHNAQEYQSTLKDLQNWEREIKEQEQKHKIPQQQNIQEATNDMKGLPVRSAVLNNNNNNNKKEMKQSNNEKNKTSKHVKSTTPDEKPETAPDPEGQKRKEANEMKDVGNRHVKFRQYDLAIEEYSAAIALCPNEPVFYTNRALCYLKLERYVECIEDCDRAIELDKLAVKAHYRRMQANENLGNYMDALKDCTSALTIEPRNVETKKSLERINERLRKHQKSQLGPNFSPGSENLIEIDPIDKPAYKRSTKPLRRVSIADVVGSKDAKTFQNLEISDDDIDKLFNSNCGPFVEVKKTNTPSEEEYDTIEPLEEKPKTLWSKIDDSKALPIETIASVENASTLANWTEVSKAANFDRNPVVAKADTIDVGQKPISKKEENAQLPNDLRPPQLAPSSTAQFYANWKELRDAQKYQYLNSIDVENLRKVLGAGFDSDTLTDCLNLLHDFYLPNGNVTAAATLLEISQNKEVAILSLLMSEKEKKTLLEVLDTLERKKLINEETLLAIKKNFNVI